MQYSGNASSLDCVSEILKITNSDLNSYPINDITRRFNGALDRFFTLAFQADGRWAFDDLNNTSPALESVNLVSGTEKYALDAFASEILNVLRVEMLDSNGNGVVLRPLDLAQTGWQSLPQYNSVAGIPMWYNKFDKWIYLYPKPNYNSTNGLSLYFERNKVAFATSDTTKVPGIPSLFHMYLCRLAALPFLIEKALPQKADVAMQVAQDEEAILDHFGHRDKDIRPRIMPKYRNPR